MLNSKLRRALAFTALASALSLAPGEASAEPRARPEREGSAAPESFSPWDLLARLLWKASARIDPEGQKASVRIDPEGERASVRIDPEGNS